MKRILVHFPDFLYGRLFDPYMRDNYADPYIYLKKRVRTLGYELNTSDQYPVRDCEWLFFFDAPSVLGLSGLPGWLRGWHRRLRGRKPIRDLYSEALTAGLGERLVLFLWEPPSIIQSNSDPELHASFPVVFTWNDALVDGKKFHKIRYPQVGHFPKCAPVPFRDKKLLVNISMNKRSPHPQELYSARRRSISHFERAQPNQFDLYGIGWNRAARWQERLLPFIRPRYSSYRGTVKNKRDVLPRYRFSLCYENISDQPGWITEKLFDAMRADCVPIYLGAPNVTDYVDAEAFIDRRQFKSDAELEKYLVSITESPYERYQEAIKSYLASDRFKAFLPPAFADTIIEVLRL